MIPRPAKYQIFSFLLLLFAAVTVPQTARADDGNTQTQIALPIQKDPWKFKDRNYFGFGTGFAKQASLNPHQTSNSELLFFQPQWTMRLYDLPKNRILYRLEDVHELTLIAMLRPRTSGIYGWNEIFRMDLNPIGRSKRTIVYVEAGAGINRFNPKIPELTGTFQFSLQVGAGFKYRPSNKRMAYGCEFTTYHFSNNGIEKPNQGINSFRVSLSINFLPKH